MTRLTLFLGLVALQTLCAMVFVSDIVLSTLGFNAARIAWTTREFLEIGAAMGLALGMVFGAVLAWRAFRDLREAHDRIDRAAGAFRDHLESRFREWNLTAAERDVALFALKGLTIEQIAGLRATSEGTIKAQTAAIYRKAGVTGRPQLLSLFIEDMVGADVPGPVTGAQSVPPSSAAAPRGAREAQ